MCVHCTCAWKEAQPERMSSIKKCLLFSNCKQKSYMNMSGHAWTHPYIILCCITLGPIEIYSSICSCRFCCHLLLSPVLFSWFKWDSVSQVKRFCCWIQMICWTHRNINAVLFTLTDNLIRFASFFTFSVILIFQSLPSPIIINIISISIGIVGIIPQKRECRQPNNIKNHFNFVEWCLHLKCIFFVILSVRQHFFFVCDVDDEEI